MTALSVGVLPLLAGWASAPLVAADASIVENVRLAHSGVYCLERADGVDKPNHGGDMAFFGRRMVLACGADDSVLENDGFVVLDITHEVPKLLGRFDCVASASDIALWGDLVFLAVDSNNDTSPTGQQPDDMGVPRPLYSGPGKGSAAAGTPPYLADRCDAPVVRDDGEGSVFKGLRIVSIADPARPQLVASVALSEQPGRNPLDPELNDRTVSAHNLTVVPVPEPSGDVRSVRVYLNDPEGSRNDAVDVPLSEPTAFTVTEQWRVNSANGTGCHDLAVFAPDGIAACSRLRGGTAIIDLATGQSPGHIYGPRHPDRVAPENQDLYAHHSGAFSYDGRTLFLSDEPLPSLALGRCARDGDPAYGALWAFSTTPNPAGSPRAGELPYLGHIRPPRLDDTEFCSSKQFNVVPMSDGRDVLVVAWTGGGTSVVEWTENERRFRTLATFVDRSGPRETWSGAWASHWYNGRIYVNNAHGCFFGPQACVGPKERGLDVLALDKALGVTDRAVRLKRYGFATQECLPLDSHPDAAEALCRS